MCHDSRYARADCENWKIVKRINTSEFKIVRHYIMKITCPNHRTKENLTCKILPHPNLKTGLPDRVGAHLILPDRDGAQSTNLNVSKRIEIRAIPNVKIHVHISNSTWFYEDRKGKPVELQPAVESSRVEKPIGQRAMHIEPVAFRR